MQVIGYVYNMLPQVVRINGVDVMPQTLMYLCIHVSTVMYNNRMYPFVAADYDDPEFSSVYTVDAFGGNIRISLESGDVSLWGTNPQNHALLTHFIYVEDVEDAHMSVRCLF